MKQSSKKIIISVSLLGIILLTVLTFLLVLDINSGSSLKNTIIYEPSRDYDDYNNFRGYLSSDSSDSSDSSVIHSDGSSNNHHSREINEPIVNYAPIGSGIIQAPPQRNYAPTNPNVRQNPNSEPVNPGIVGPGHNYAPVNPPNPSAQPGPNYAPTNPNSGQQPHSEPVSPFNSAH